MKAKSELESELRAAQKDPLAADRFIEKYLPFIRAETARFTEVTPLEGNDAMSIAMFAFYECIMAYRPERGAFLGLAATGIRHRLIDYFRKEKQTRNTVSMETPIGIGEYTLEQVLADQDDALERLPERMASQRELRLFAEQLGQFGISLPEVADECPRQERTMSACMRVLQYAKEMPSLLDQMVRTGKLPLSQLARGAGVDRRTIEHHRKYVLAILLAYTNGYEIIRGHLCEMNRKEAKQR